MAGKRARGLPTATINALRAHGITNPEKLTVGELLRVPGLGVAGVWNIANRVYQSFYHGRDPILWPELDPDYGLERE